MGIRLAPEEDATALVVCADDALRAAIAAVMGAAVMTDGLVLGRRGLRVDAVETPEEGRRTIRRRSPSVIVVAGAYRDPACDTLLAELARQGAPVVVVCTNPLSVHLAEDLDLVFIRAPFDVDDLLRAVDDASYRSIDRSGIR